MAHHPDQAAWRQAIAQVLTRPSCPALSRLQAEMLQAGVPPDAPVLRTLRHFFDFLNRLSAGMSARAFSHTATLWDIGAISGVAVQNLLEPGTDRASLWKRLLAGGLSEGMMVLASRQYVRAAETEIVAVYRDAAWYLFEALWQLSARQQPELDPARRRLALEALLAPAHGLDTPAPVRAALLGRLFQVLLLAQLDPLLADGRTDSV